MTVFILLLSVGSLSMGEVSTKVYLADGETPLELTDPNVPHVYRDIMVGTKLSIIVSSDVAKDWSGVLLIEGLDRENGTISVRDNNDVTANRTGSIFTAAGEDVYIRYTEDYLSTRVIMYTGEPIMTGDWFLFDYTATNIGNCRVGFYELVDPPVDDFDPNNEPVPKLVLLNELVFSHVPSRDFNGDAKVDFVDYAIISAFNGMTNCADTNDCEGTDLDLDGDVDSDDFVLFADYWLERTE